ncbi:hypothetical protein JX265_011928 [Neoarthrinium moseri]|uniref:Uncharacterized protein n=1 Tax=Neoarthrinium moseri TaxID=1658444 RepID=A0A9P9WBP0_9PEZI|nr:hypothetical protein JX265_011928 [Neoarthrinium moseri]
MSGHHNPDEPLIGRRLGRGQISSGLEKLTSGDEHHEVYAENSQATDIPDDRFRIEGGEVQLRLSPSLGARAARAFPSRWLKNLGIFSFGLLLFFWITSRTGPNIPPADLTSPQIDGYLPPLADIAAHQPADTLSPIDWLRENTYNQPTYTLPISKLEALIADKPRAAFIALVRNSEEVGMVHSILQVEARFNSRKTHRYDWVFFNDEPFTESFMAAVSNATSSTVYFEQIIDKHWRMPDWIDKSRYDVGRQFQGSIGVGKSWLESYHQMCRWNSGLFALEDRLKNYDWYWRVEPDVQYTCNINYDVFRFMRDNNMAYGFNMAILDDARSFPSLWERTQTFKRYNPDMVNPEADMRWLLHQTAEPDRMVRSGSGYHAGRGDQYNNCQFYSNFEVGSLDFFRSKEHQAYFQHLDKSGGFFYERYGDAPIHTLSVSMFLPKRRVWFFRDIGYSHGICESCPPHVSKLPMGPEPDARRIKAAELSSSMGRGHRRIDLLSDDLAKKKLIPGLQCGCTTSALDAAFAKLVPYESKQLKPIDTCIRLWLRGKYLLKRSNWSRKAELDAGGDGYGGYEITGLEANPFPEAPGTISITLDAVPAQDEQAAPRAMDNQAASSVENGEVADHVHLELEVDVTPIQI